MLSIVVPVYNEKDTIREIVQRVESVKLEDIEKEIVVVDDFSDDGTREIVRRLNKTKEIKVLFHEENRGKGACLRTGLREIRGDIVIIQDADLEYDPREYPKLIRPIIEKRADVVYGSRVRSPEGITRSSLWQRIGNKTVTRLSNMLTSLRLTDIGACYKAFKTEVLQSIDLEEEGFGFDAEFTAKIAKKEYRISEVGISYKPRTYREGKKIGLKDGFHILWCILKYNLPRR